MKYTKIHDRIYTKMIIGYKPEIEGYYIRKESHLTWSGSEILDGWEVFEGSNYFVGRRIYFADTLKEAKQYLERILGKETA